MAWEPGIPCAAAPSGASGERGSNPSTMRECIKVTSSSNALRLHSVGSFPSQLSGT